MDFPSCSPRFDLQWSRGRIEVSRNRAAAVREFFFRARVLVPGFVRRRAAVRSGFQYHALGLSAATGLVLGLRRSSCRWVLVIISPSCNLFLCGIVCVCLPLEELLAVAKFVSLAVRKQICGVVGMTCCRSAWECVPILDSASVFSVELA
jgi:hypothetical protein